MDEIREAARAYCDNFSDEQKQRASQFFQLLDADGDGRVSTREFLDFLLKEERIAPDLVPQLFQKLDANGDGVLDFWECMTLYYMTRAGRLVFCNGCGSYLDGIRFACVPCFGSNVNGRGRELDPPPGLKLILSSVRC
ncbi:unnamed protein product [Thlaspi arvense]|uniref:EF-hand domain-containing protein n=1 Tax=Thlaspi arvense TaxID=13288 RepID=A0AAU9RST4_THLAR|nr:unnamed protein product [Thlaspi arvense]